MTTDYTDVREVAVRELGRALEPLGTAAEEGVEGIIVFGLQAGVDLQALLDSADDLESVAAAIESAYGSIESIVETGEVDLDDLPTLVHAIGNIVSAIDDLRSLQFVADAPLIPEEAVDRLVDLLVVRYLRTYHSGVYGVLAAIGMIDENGPDEHLPRVDHAVLQNLFRPPAELLYDYHGWGGYLDSDIVLTYLKQALLEAGIPARVEYPLTDELRVLGVDPDVDPVELELAIPLVATGRGANYVEAGIRVVPLLNDTGTDAEFAVLPYGVSGTEMQYDLSNAWFFRFEASGTAASWAWIPVTARWSSLRPGPT
jgi:hypothetical protein